MINGLNLSQSVIGNCWYAPVCFLADRRSQLKFLDDLFGYFEIEQQTAYWKDRLKENWLIERDDRERLRKFNRLMSGICELIVARAHIENRQKVRNLEAWGGNSDIELENGTHIEIKFMGEEFHMNQLLLGSIRTGRPQIGHPNPIATANYAMFRLAEGVFQHIKNGVDPRSRQVLLVCGDDISYRTVAQMPEAPPREWLRSGDAAWGTIPLDSNRIRKILSKQPAEWLRELPSGGFRVGKLESLSYSEQLRGNGQ